MDGTRLKQIFKRIIRTLDASEEEVYIRTYIETGGHPESGTPPERTPIDTPILPRPAVLDASYKADALMERTTPDMQVLAGDKKVVMAGDAEIGEGSILRFAGVDWRVYRVEKPVLFGSAQLIIAYVRKVMQP